MNGRRDGGPRLVYSSEQGRICPGCGRPARECACSRKPAPARECACSRKPAPARGDGVVRVSRETKGRKGKGVSVVTGLPLDEGALDQLARELKQKCGAGGTVKDGRIEIQGDHRETLLEALRAKGYAAKLAGG